MMKLFTDSSVKCFFMLFFALVKIFGTMILFEDEIIHFRLVIIFMHYLRSILIDIHPYKY